jgi:hypothetical protein
MEKLGIIVPYRNRYDHLEEFKKSIVEYLDSNSYKNYVIIIVEQDDAKLFNRGMLLNIGFKEAKEQGCDYVVFHDVDMLPINVDYSYSDKPLHLSTDFILEEGEKPRTIFDEYFGGVTLFPIDKFEEVDGYSNKYWGWGYEDDDLRLRCLEKHIPLQTHKIKNFKSVGQSLKLNGVDAYVKVKNTIDFRQSFSLHISFYPDKLYLNHEKESDEFTVFSIPGYDFGISYTSFKRYNFCFFDSKFEPYYINSNIKPNYKTNIIVTYDSLSKVAKVYQDGEFIGETGEFKRIYPYNTKEYYYLGVGNPEREKIPNFFKGYIDSFAQWDKVLSDIEIYDISKSETKLLNENFDNYNSSNSLNTYYDANYIKYYKLTDLSANENHGEIINCEVVDLDIPEYTEVKIPYRRKSLFKSLKHDENGFDGQKWKDKHTRYNQLRFVNEVSNHISLISRDGLSTLEYHTYGRTKTDNIIHLNVGI